MANSTGSSGRSTKYVPSKWTPIHGYLYLTSNGQPSSKQSPADSKINRALLPHERDLLAAGELANDTHDGASAVWLTAPSFITPSPTPATHASSSSSSSSSTSTSSATCTSQSSSVNESKHDDDNKNDNNDVAIWSAANCTRVYRPVGDLELMYLVDNNALPSTQPYQAIIEGDAGRTYAEKYLLGAKWVNTSPSTVVEFIVPRELIATLFARQHKAEDGAVSMGLGDRAGAGLPLFNLTLANGTSRWRIVKVKRRPRNRADTDVTLATPTISTTTTSSSSSAASSKIESKTGVMVGKKVSRGGKGSGGGKKKK